MAEKKRTVTIRRWAFFEVKADYAPRSFEVPADLPKDAVFDWLDENDPTFWPVTAWQETATEKLGAVEGEDFACDDPDAPKEMEN